MMINKGFYLAPTVLFLFFCTAIFGMNKKLSLFNFNNKSPSFNKFPKFPITKQTPKSPDNQLLIKGYGPTGYVQNMANAINNTKFGKICVGSLTLTNKRIINALKNAVQRNNVEVDGIFGKRFGKLNKDAINLLKKNDATIQERNNFHSKHLITPDCAFGGSYNFSNLGIFNDELMFKTKDPDLIASLIETHKDFAAKTPKKNIQKKVLEKTPKKPTVINSRKYRLNKSDEHRLQSLKKGDSCKIVTYAFNDRSLTETIIEKSKKVNIELLVDPNGTKDTSCLDKLYDKLSKAGVAGVLRILSSENKIFGKYKKKFHIKLSTRETTAKQPGRNTPQKKYYVRISTANSTKQGDKEKNLHIVIPNDKQLYDEAQEYFDKLKKQSTISYDQWKKDLQQEKKNQKKRKLDQQNKTRSVKRKILFGRK